AARRPRRPSPRGSARRRRRGRAAARPRRTRSRAPARARCPTRRRMRRGGRRAASRAQRHYGVADAAGARARRGAVRADRRRTVSIVIRGTLAAALTPLREDGAAVDPDAIGPYVDFLAAG